MKVELGNIDIKKLLLTQILPTAILLYISNKITEAILLSVGNNFTEKFNYGVKMIMSISENPLPNLNFKCFLLSVIMTMMIRVYLYVKSKNKKQYRKGVEYGSARWGTATDIKPFIDSEFQNNLLFTETERLTLSSRVNPPKNARNKNGLVIGGSGSGKTRFVVKPNLMQMHSSYVVTDPKGTLLPEVGKMLHDNGYSIKTFNTIDFSKSMHYNPFVYMEDEKDILKLVNTIMLNTSGEGLQAKEDFWVKAERLYLQALIGYIFYEAPEQEKNFSTLLEFIDASEVREDDEDFKNAVDLMFDELEERESKKGKSHFAVRQYKKYKLAAGKTAKSILISCAARLSPFDIEQIREITTYDELELNSLGERKTALFVIISDTDTTFNFLVAIMYTQMFNFLCTLADNKYKGRLPIHVRCLLDEFANIGKIPNFETLIATIRSREISACLILQAKSQLKAIYKDHADTIVGNCDSELFLGGSEKTTLKDLSENLGKETIDLMNTSENRGRDKTFGNSNQKLGKSLMSEDEIKVMDGGKCIYQLRGVRPFFSRKYDIEKHPNYKLLADFDEKNYFDMKKFLNSNQLVIKSNDEVFLFEV